MTQQKATTALRLPSWPAVRGLWCAAVVCVVIVLVGCSSGATLLSYIGGGLPPGEPDIGGVVLATTPTTAVASEQAGTVPVVGARVDLVRGRGVVGTATTGEGGYFRFEGPDSGSYEVVVTPPQGSGWLQARRQFRHTQGRQTFLTVVLEPEYSANATRQDGPALLGQARPVSLLGRAGGYWLTKYLGYALSTAVFFIHLTCPSTKVMFMPSLCTALVHASMLSQPDQPQPPPPGRWLMKATAPVLPLEYRCLESQMRMSSAG